MPPIRERITNREALLGIFLQTGSAVVADIAGRAGFDWALIDLEHGSGGESDLVPQLLALRASRVPAFVRVESAARLRIGRALDMGASGVMVPQVNDVATARQVVDWCRYPPSGARGVALSARGADYGGRGHAEVGDIDGAVVRIAQVETRAAVDAVDQIAAVDGLDVLFVGPSDLSHSMGIPGRFGDPSFAQALASIADAGAAHGRALGVHLPNMTELARYLDHGFTFISVAADSLSLAASFRNVLSTARAHSV
jgi:2-dehydro-3-deoxyglucarate aldolase/4-hydroxy-2-oxoheptanedioate aldolase